MQQQARVIRCSDVVPDPVRWVLTEETVPESSPHVLITDRIRDLLQAWVARTSRDAKVGRSLAVRWDRSHPQFGVDPDVYLVEPPPPEGDLVQSLKLWKQGHVPPRLAVEVVSASHPTKDYVIAPQKYAVCGVEELWILDMFLDGPRAHGGPHRIQVWRRLDDALFQQVHAGEGPAWSELLHAWVHAAPNAGSWTVDLSTNEAGNAPWLTIEEAERKARQQAEQQAEAARRRIEELEALLKRQAG